MTRAKLMTAVMAAALFSAPALAQTQSSPAPASPAPAAAPAAPATPAPHVTEQKKGEWLGSKMPGVDVYNASDEKIGDIADLLFDREGKVTAVIISVGGFLGMGKHDVAVPIAEIKWVDEAPPARTATPAPTGMPGTTPRAEPQTTGTVTTPAAPAAPANEARAYPHHIVVNMTADQLKAAPAFKYAK